jgi:hypothetical protein
LQQVQLSAPKQHAWACDAIATVLWPNPYVGKLSTPFKDTRERFYDVFCAASGIEILSIFHSCTLCPLNSECTAAQGCTAAADHSD